MIGAKALPTLPKEKAMIPQPMTPRGFTHSFRAHLGQMVENSMRSLWKPFRLAGVTRMWNGAMTRWLLMFRNGSTIRPRILVGSSLEMSPTRARQKFFQAAKGPHLRNLNLNLNWIARNPQ